MLEDHVKAVDHEVQSLRLTFETAEKEKLEAETKLTVLSNYFKEKENQLHKFVLFANLEKQQGKFFF